MIPPTAATIKPSIWPYAIAGYFALALAAIVIFVLWIVPQRMDLVRPDYYEHEILFQQRIDAVNRAQPFRKELSAVYNPSAKTILLSLPGGQMGAEFQGKAHLYRPSDARLDQHIDLKPGPDGKQAIDASKLASGLWKVRLDWTANGQAFAFEQAVIVGG